MGIRFNCPNGHRLNVKSFLAGKRGFCPHCGIKLLIPEVSGRTSGISNTDPTVALELTVDGTDSPVINELAPVGTTDTSPAADVQWFVRPASGGQYGPANDAALNQWVTEGRIGLDTLLWREGWENWRYASQVLPTLAHIPQPNIVDTVSSAAPNPPRPAGPKSSGPIQLDSAETGLIHPRRRARRFSAALIAGLGIVSILLVVVLVFVAGMDR
jgi:hypothetical protein